ncbi:MAG TPA: terminase small subunit [Anaerolineae bacterium]|nr:terminase small subunit [Anaerolineae bacterium]
MALTNKQRVFVEEYLRCWNGAEAARRAGYKRPCVSAHENLRKLYIQEVIEKRIREKAMSADEVLVHLADVARFDAGLLFGKGGIINWEDAKKHGYTQFVKKLDWSPGALKVEIYDKMEALELLGKHQAMWVERHQIESDGTLKVVYVNDWRGDLPTDTA